MSAPTKLIVANWKMNELRAEAEDLATAVAHHADESAADIVICPPFTLLTIVGQDLAGSRVSLGGQDCHSEERGAFTGDISARMLKDVGATYVIVGHSERRAHYGETNEMVARKVQAAGGQGLVAIVCVGESQQVRQSGHAVEYVCRQLRESLPKTGMPERLVVAYEPVWAIGTGKSCDDGDITAMHGALRDEVAKVVPDGKPISIIYGGSANADNAGRLLSLDHVDGLLVGGASLEAKSFIAIVAAAKNAVGRAG